MSYRIDVLALEFGDQLLQTFFVSVDADGFEDGLDVFGGGGGVATEPKEEVCCEVLHLVLWIVEVRGKTRERMLAVAV